MDNMNFANGDSVNAVPDEIINTEINSEPAAEIPAPETAEPPLRGRKKRKAKKKAKKAAKKAKKAAKKAARQGKNEFVPDTDYDNLDLRYPGTIINYNPNKKEMSGVPVYTPQ